MLKNKMRIGADVGGTFTDVVLETEGGIFSTKVLTTYESPEIGILQGINAVIADSGTDLSELDSFSNESRNNCCCCTCKSCLKQKIHSRY